MNERNLSSTYETKTPTEVLSLEVTENPISNTELLLINILKELRVLNAK